MSKEIKLYYRQHAIKRMYERSISEEEVEKALEKSVVIDNYPDDQPFPSTLVLGYAASKAIHIVYADDIESATRIIITVYEPDPAIWQVDLKKRR